MKKILPLILVVLLLTGCRQKAPEEGVETPPEEPPVSSAEETEPNRLEQLTVEISRNDTDKELLVRAVKELPELLKDCFDKSLAAGSGVEVQEVKVTVGSSPAATVDALAAGTVDLAFLPVETFLLESDAEPLLANAPQQTILGERALSSDWNDAETTYGDTWSAGEFALICTAPTEYGEQLASRVESQIEEKATNSPTWDEVNHARWGVLDGDSLGGYRCLNLWLVDRYEGQTAADLRSVTVYESYEELFRAAAQGKIDAFPIRADARVDVAEAWTVEASNSAQSGMRGFGRERGVWEEVRCIGVTDALYHTVAATGQEALSGGRFQSALADALEFLYEKDPDLAFVLGSAHFDRVEEQALAPMRRLLTVEGKTGGNS